MESASDSNVSLDFSDSSSDSSAQELDLDLISCSESDISDSSVQSNGKKKRKRKQKLKESTIGARIQAVTLLEIKVPIVKITARTGLSKAGIYRWWHEAVKRGWNQTGVVEVEHVSNKEWSGRPKISEALENFILFTMLKNSTTRMWSCRRISYEVSNTPGWQKVSASTVYRTLKSNGYSVFKRTVKPGLTDEQKKIRLQWCLDHKDWTLEDWKNVIFSDETSVIIGGVRGKKRVWRKKEETFHPHVVVRR